MLFKCARQGHEGSQLEVADLSLFGSYHSKINTTLAFELLDQTFTFATAQDPVKAKAQQFRNLGLIFATGLGTKRDYKKALIYLSIAALDDDLIAHHTLGYFYHAGIGVPKNCPRSLWHYQRVADAVLDSYLGGPLGGNRLLNETMDLSQDGLYGKGASGNGNPEKSKGREPELKEADLVILYKLQAEGGDPGSQFMLGQLYYLGGDDVPIDYGLAAQYLTMAAKQFPRADYDASIPSHRQAKIAASRSCSYMGIMHARGEGTPVNLELAKSWFERGVSQEDPSSHTWLARMYLDGIGVKKDYETGTLSGIIA
jgi:SEL1 protein